MNQLLIPIFYLSPEFWLYVLTVLWDTKGPDPEFTTEARKQDNEIWKSAQSVAVFPTLYIVMTTFPRA